MHTPPDQGPPHLTRSRKARRRPARATKLTRTDEGASRVLRDPPVVAALAPYLSVAKASETAGIGRSKLYVLLGEGQILAKKLGSKTLIDTASLLGYLVGLPAARIAPSRKRTASMVSETAGA
jgi:hypothetical protein